MAVHFRISQADEFADKRRSAPDGAVHRWIRQVEREVIPQVDALVYMSRWAKEALTQWLPEAAEVPSAIIGCAGHARCGGAGRGPGFDLVTIGNLDIVKNHRFLLAVLAEAKRRGHEYTPGRVRRGPLLGDLLRRTRELGLEGQVTFRGSGRTRGASSWLPGLPSRRLLRVVLPGDRRGDGGRPAGRGRSHRSDPRALRRRRRRALLAARRRLPGG